MHSLKVVQIYITKPKSERQMSLWRLVTKVLGPLRELWCCIEIGGRRETQKYIRIVSATEAQQDINMNPERVLK